MGDEFSNNNAVLTRFSDLDPVDFNLIHTKLPVQIWVRSPDFKIRYQNFEGSFLDDEDERADQEVMSTRQVTTQIKKHAREDEVRWYQVKRVPLPCGVDSEQPASLSVLGVSTDITEFYRSIEGCEKLLSSVSHDLKNPISSILLSAAVSRKLITEATDDNLKVQSAKACGFLKSIEGSCQTIMQLISNVLDSTRSSSGEVPLRLEKCNICDLMEEVLSLLGPLARHKSQTLSIDMGDIGKQKWELFCDRVRMLQIFSNLIGNAIKFTPAGGSVKVNIKRMDSEVFFEVSDNGPGISAEQLPYVFNRYWQGCDSESSRTRRNENGVGLGLSIAQKNVEAHNGKIWIDSRVSSNLEQSSGTHVYFTLPER